MKLSVREITIIGLFAAILAVLSQLSLPMPWGIPITGQVLGVFIAGGLLGAKLGTWTVAVYTLLGAAGVPVFAQGEAGLGVLLGPKGGYLLGFIAGVYLLGRIAGRSGTMRLIFGMSACLIVTYSLGSFQFAWVTGRSASEALALAVLPFVPFDLVKLAVALPLIKALRKRMAELGFNCGWADG